MFNVGPEIVMLLISKLFAVSAKPLEVPEPRKLVNEPPIDQEANDAQKESVP